MSINFHRLPSGAFCISRTTPSGLEYSGRGGCAIYTQCLIVRRHAGPVRQQSLRAVAPASANGAVRQYEQPPDA